MSFNLGNALRRVTRSPVVRNALSAGAIAAVGYYGYRALSNVRESPVGGAIQSVGAQYDQAREAAANNQYLGLAAEIYNAPSVPQTPEAYQIPLPPNAPSGLQGDIYERVDPSTNSDGSRRTFFQKVGNWIKTGVFQ